MLFCLKQSALFYRTVFSIVAPTQPRGPAPRPSQHRGGYPQPRPNGMTRPRGAAPPPPSGYQPRGSKENDFIFCSFRV